MQILGLCGSLRKDSYNKKLLHIAIDMLKKEGHTVSFFDMKENPLPLFDEDIESEGCPKNVKQLQKEIKKADLIVVASPEYNGTISAPLKNAIDWASRDGNYWKDKVIAIMSASTSGFGGIQSQMHLRHSLANEYAHVLPQPRLYVSKCQDAFTDTGEFVDPSMNERLNSLLKSATAYAQKLNT